MKKICLFEGCVSKDGKDFYYKVRLKRHNFAFVQDEQIGFNCVERRKNYAVILKELRYFIECAKFEQA